MSKVFLVSYATDRFESVRRDLNSSAIEMGISNILSYSPDDLHGSTFYQLNREILDAECGAGYWAWKPYFILEALEHLKEGDVLFYCDAGSKFVLLAAATHRAMSPIRYGGHRLRCETINESAVHEARLLYQNGLRRVAVLGCEPRDRNPDRYQEV